jgi:hypothetical protein
MFMLRPFRLKISHLQHLVCSGTKKANIDGTGPSFGRHSGHASPVLHEEYFVAGANLLPLGYGLILWLFESSADVV